MSHSRRLPIAIIGPPAFFCAGFAMGIAATLVFLLAVCAYGLYKLVRADRRAGAARADAMAEKQKRLEREKELLGRLGKIREKKDDLQSAKDAIRDDPKRAAKVVARMMRKKD